MAKNNHINHKLYFQVSVAREFMTRHHLSPQQFVDLDNQKKILCFLADGYHILTLSGQEAIEEELDEYVFGKL